jgi:hypothetical protein
MFPQERVYELFAALAEPFDGELVEWRVTNTAPGKHGYRGQVVAYADQRAYTDRLNSLFTPAGWTREYSVQTAQNFERPTAGSQGKTTIITAKIMVTCRVTIFGLGSHSGTGEEWANDENALTRAEAQSFKRACSCFGLGRYFYDLPRTWVDLDENRRPVELPSLPEWALPRSYKAHDRPSGLQQTNGAPRAQNGSTKGIFAQEVRERLRLLAEEIGFSLTSDVVQRTAGRKSLDEVKDGAKLTSLLDKMEDLARGVRRLRSAIAVAGPEVYGRKCQELNLASDSIDDIPNREVLRQLVTSMESAVAERGAPEANGNAGDISAMRGRLLQEARRVAAQSRKSLAEVIAIASGGLLEFAELGRLSATDCAKVQTAIQELERMAASRG